MKKRSKKKFKPLIKKKRISQRIEQLAGMIENDFKGTELILIGLLKGSFIFLADLVRSLHKADITLVINFIHVSSYGDNTVSSKNFKLEKNISIDINKKNVLLVDDILDTGRTLHFVHSYLIKKHPEILKTCVLLDKPARRAVPFKADYRGFEVENKFLIGYGLDYQGLYRELPYISTIDPND